MDLNLNFKKLKVTYEEINDNHAKVHFTPLERGFGMTYGNSLRRVLLGFIPGTAIIGMEIEGVPSEFVRIQGTVNTGTDLILKLKQIRFKIEEGLEEKLLELTFQAKKEGAYTAKDLILPKGVQCLTPDVELLKLTGDKEVTMKLYLTTGRGFVDALAHPQFEEFSSENLIPIDGMFKPVERVAAHVTKIRLGQNTEFENLTIEVETNGAIKAVDAVTTASKILRELLVFTDEMEQHVEKIEIIEKEKEKENHVLDKTVEELGLTVRPYNRLKKVGCETVRDILKLSLGELRALDQMGKKSITELQDKLKELGYELKEE